MRRSRPQSPRPSGQSAGAAAPAASDRRLQTLLRRAAAQRNAGEIRKAEATYRSVLAIHPECPEALHWLGAIRHQRGDNSSAVQLLEKAAAIQPGNPLCLFHLAEVRRALGRYSEAVEAYTRVLAQRRDIADVHYGLGSALLELNRPREAAVPLEEALRLAPNDSEAHNNLGNALAALGQTEEAVKHYRAALRLEPHYLDAQLNLGIALISLERDSDAELAFRAVLDHDPCRVGATRELASLLIRNGRAGEALALLRTLTAKLEGSADAAHARAETLSQCGRHEEALEWYDRCVALSPDTSAYWNDFGRALAKLQRFEEALEPYGRAIALQPERPHFHFNRGVALQALGRFDAAIEAHETALSLQPSLTEAHHSLSMIHRGRDRRSEIERLEALLADPGLTNDQRVNGHFALGRLYDECGEVAKAFGSFQSANTLKAQQMPFDPARFGDYVDRLNETYDLDFFAARTDHGNRSRRPIFIVGMPRSGTTLVEQILASHPDVHGGGELDDIRQMINRLPELIGGTKRYPACAEAIDRPLSRDLAGEYLDSLERLCPTAPHITDKMTGNYLRLGLIGQILPNATVVHCRRDPLDTCLSCYFQNFADGLAFSYDLRHLGYVYREHDRLMAHWHAVLPVPILELTYEALVKEPEAQVRRLLAFCGLPWSESCLDFHLNRREVQTASFWQVRQPLYTSSIGRSRAYADYLGPLQDGLEGRV